MELLQIIQNMGFEPKRASSSNGGEYHCPCPGCGGLDRFIIWTEQNRYWCRQCKKSGDTIQFYRDFLGSSFQEAKEKTQGYINNNKISPKKISSDKPSDDWLKKANEFVAQSHQYLLNNLDAKNTLHARGLSLQTMIENKLGFNPEKIFDTRKTWGLDKPEKKLILPPGVVIPSFAEYSLQRVKIRRNDWKENDPFGKYYQLPGSSNICCPIGNLNLPSVVIVEAEFDALLIVQESGDLCCALPLGGAQKKADPKTHEWLQKKQTILFSLDFDEAGKEAFYHWRSTYPQLKPWPVPQGKSSGDAFVHHNVDLRRWIGAFNDQRCD